MGQNGPFKGTGSTVYVDAWQFFKKRELRGIKLPRKKAKTGVEATARRWRSLTSRGCIWMERRTMLCRFMVSSSSLCSFIGLHAEYGMKELTEEQTHRRSPPQNLRPPKSTRRNPSPVPARHIRAIPHTARQIRHGEPAARFPLQKGAVRR
jgi:hypothetical protein